MITKEQQTSIIVYTLTIKQQSCSIITAYDIMTVDYTLEQ